MIITSISGVALWGFLVGLSPSYTIMIILLVLLGLTSGGYHPSSSPLVSAAVAPKNQGRALGIHQVGGTLSFFLAPLIAVGIAASLGWRGSFISVAIPVFIFGIGFYLLLRRRRVTTKAVSTATEDTETKLPRAQLRRLIAVIVIGIAIQAVLFSAVSYLPLFAVDTLGVSMTTAAILLSVFHSGGLWAGPAGGYLSDRIGKVPVLLALSLLSGPVLYLLNITSFGWGIFLTLIVLGASMYVAMLITEGYIVTHTSPQRRSTILGIYFSASRGGPGLIIPLLGYIIDLWGFFTAFTIASATLLAIALASCVVLRDKGG
ncbi:MAG: MFS transporter [Dehalococcoidia bacterium]|nr:MAG: MFS transporter [Dehalococcoidia bacterium]